MLDLFAILPRLPISTEAALLLSALIISIAAALTALLRNRRVLRAPLDEGGDMGAIFENPQAIMPHVLELRSRIIRALIAIAVATVTAMILADQVLVVLAEPIGGFDKLQVIRVTEPVSVWFRVALTVGIILASPFVFAQLWLFIVAGLKPTERRAFYLLFPFALILFLTGIAFAYFIMLPVSVDFLTNFLGFPGRPTLEDYVKFVTTVLLWVGVSFELPLIMFALAKMKLVTARMLAQNWRIAVVLIAALAAVVTPTPDPINMGIVAAPLLVLYVLSIVLALFA